MIKNNKGLSKANIIIIVAVIVVIAAIALWMMISSNGENNSGVIFINSERDMQALQDSNNWNKTFILTKNIDMSNTKNWKPVGTVYKKFSGTFNGNGHTIDNFSIDRRNEENVGVFGYVSSEGVIKDCNLTHISINGAFTTGGLAAIFEGKANNIKIGGKVNAKGSNSIGGAFGIFNGTAENILCKVIVTGDSRVGGFAGDVQGGKISRVYVGTGTTVNADGGQVGGLVGVAKKKDLITIENCYSKAVLYAVSGRCGGLVGSAITYSESEEDSIVIKDCYYVGDISKCSTKAGGLIGDIDSSSIGRVVLTNCFCAAYVDRECNPYRGGVIGYIEKNSSRTTNKILWVNMYTDSTTYSGVGSDSINFSMLLYDFSEKDITEWNDGNWVFNKNNSPKNRVLLKNEPTANDWAVFD